MPLLQPKHQRWLWLAGAALLVPAVFMLSVRIPALRAQQAQLDNNIGAIQASLRAPLSAAGSGAHLDLAAQLPRFERLAMITTDLQALATQNGLALTDATYKPLNRGSVGRVDAVEIGARMKGGYPGLKKTLAELLASHEGLALASMSVRRARAADAPLDIELRLTFYYQKA